jgi:hypothetical protein
LLILDPLTLRLSNFHVDQRRISDGRGRVRLRGRRRLMRILSVDLSLASELRQGDLVAVALLEAFKNVTALRRE